MAHIFLENVFPKWNFVACMLLILITETRPLNLGDIKAECKVHPNVVVVTDPGHHRFFPPMVYLPRCVGSIGLTRPSERKCVAASTESFSYVGLKLPDFSKVVIALEHHIRCVGRCRISKVSCNKYQQWMASLCVCRCKYSMAPASMPCKQPLVWDKSTCSCMCKRDPEVCPVNKEWNNETCSCFCKGTILSRCAQEQKLVNEKTCQCMKPNSNVNSSARGGDNCKNIEKSTIILIVAIEFLTLTFFFFVIYRCCLKKDDTRFLRTMRRMTTFMRRGGPPLQREGSEQQQGSEQGQKQGIEQEWAHKSLLANGNPLVDTHSRGGSFHNQDHSSSSSPSGGQDVAKDQLMQDSEIPVGFYNDGNDKLGSRSNISMRSRENVTIVGDSTPSGRQNVAEDQLMEDNENPVGFYDSSNGRPGSRSKKSKRSREKVRIVGGSTPSGRQNVTKDQLMEDDENPVGFYDGSNGRLGSRSKKSKRSKEKVRIVRSSSPSGRQNAAKDQLMQGNENPVGFYHDGNGKLGSRSNTSMRSREKVTIV